MTRLMIVDDSLFQRKYLGKMIEKMGWEVVGEASNGREAIEKYHLSRPDLVLMDLLMPEMEGIVAVKKIIEIDKDAKIVVVSSLGYGEIIDKALLLGAKQFITKPINFENASNTLKSVLSESAHSEEEL